MPPEKRPFLKIIWVAVGHGALEYGHSRLSLSRDEFLFAPSGQVHRFVDEPTAPITLVMAYLSEQVVEKSPPLQAVLSQLLSFGTLFPQVKLNIYRRGAVSERSFSRTSSEHGSESFCLPDSFRTARPFFSIPRYRRLCGSRAFRVLSCLW